MTPKDFCESKLCGIFCFKSAHYKGLQMSRLSAGVVTLKRGRSLWHIRALFKDDKGIIQKKPDTKDYAFQHISQINLNGKEFYRRNRNLYI